MAQVWTGPIPLTTKQLEALQVLHELVDQQGMQPTYSQLANELELTAKSSVCRVLHQLCEKGWITLEPHANRIRILHPPPILPDCEMAFVGCFEDARLLAEFLASLDEHAMEATA
ncbi:LexA family protein [Azospirillum doebereinerae]|uniref:LexA repressor DNA-binding domain-containing protein n=1 Tax=Azospirillum doebereinerae TaxID=92933 RepID=A0A433J2U0_9PROT|nr:hypothetical protein [Azospirillum doebereinerae]RUQ66010.1 hypothetical protein EJ913_24545 [Azospirillum doebereinerae]